MNRVLVLDKEQDMTSYDCIRKLKPFLHKGEKIGHAGTLDPMATGVLPILIGKTTKLFDIFTGSRKTYIGEMTFGIKTDTADITGKTIEAAEHTPRETGEIEEAFGSFVGGYLQVPPVYSAKRKNGKRLYDLARAESEEPLPEIDPEFVDMFSYQIYHYEPETKKLIFSVEVGKGFYVRSFVEDVAAYFNEIATLSSLRRVKTGHFSLDKAVKMDTIETREDIEKASLSVEEATVELPALKVNDKMADQVLNGSKLKLAAFNDFNGYVRLMDKNEKVLAIGHSCYGEFKYVAVLGE